MKRRQAILMSAGVLPVLAQVKSEFQISSAASSLSSSNPFVKFSNANTFIEFGWDLATMELVVRDGGREARIPKNELLDALGAK